MRSRFYICLFIVFQGSVFASNVESLREAYLSLTYRDAGNVEYKRNFFDAFPNDYLTFDSIFGYSAELVHDSSYGDYHERRYGELAKEGYDYIDMYFKISDAVNVDSFCMKTLRICCGHFYFRENITFFHTLLIRYALEKSLLSDGAVDNPLWRNLSKFSLDEIQSFWKFYIHRPFFMENYESINKELCMNMTMKITELTLKDYPKLKRAFIDNNHEKK